MGFRRNTRKINMGPATGKEKRGRARRKPQISVRKIPKAGAKGDPSTPVGATQELLITLDSEDNALASTPSHPARRRTDILLIDSNPGGFRCHPYKPLGGQNTPNGSVHAPLENTYAPTGFVLRRSSPLHTKDTRHQKRARSPEKTNTQTLAGSFAYQDASSDVVPSPLSHEGTTVLRQPAMRHKHHHLSSSPAAYGRSTRTQGAGICTGSSNASPHDRSTTMANAGTSRFSIRAKSDASASRGTLMADEHPREWKAGDQHMSLMDIDDFGLRSKVAQLMAVAPALAIVDLYHLIIDSEGDLPRARKQAIRMSEAPAAQYQPVPDADGNEIMVKIDLNDPAFEWDDDEPHSELNATTKARSSKPKANSQPRGSATKSRSLHNPVKPAKSAMSDTKKCSNICAKRTKSAYLNPTHTRETSSDRDFVVPDNVIHYDVDSEQSNDSDQSTSTDLRNRCADSDTKMLDGDNGIDLDIDLQPRFACNARLFGDIRARKI